MQKVMPDFSVLDRVNLSRKAIAETWVTAEFLKQHGISDYYIPENLSAGTCVCDGANNIVVMALVTNGGGVRDGEWNYCLALKNKAIMFVDTPNNYYFLDDIGEAFSINELHAIAREALKVLYARP
jgi:hypothetical protein